MTILDLLLILLFAWLLLYLLFSFLKNTKIAKRILKNFEIQPFALLLKTEKFNEFILKTGKKRAKTFKILGELSIFYGIALMIYGIFFLAKNILALLFPSANKLVGQASPVIPLLFGITFSPPVDQLVIILIVIVLAVVFHELFHGFLASSEEMKIKSTGAGVVLLIPIAFVELDDESIKNVASRKKMRMLSAGSFINLAQASIFLFLFLSFPLAIAWGYTMESQGVLIYSVSKNSPAMQSGIIPGDAIIAMNGTIIKNYQDFTSFLENTKPNQTLILTIERNLERFNLEIKLAQSPYFKDRGFIGVSTVDYHRPYFSFIPQFLQFYIYLFILWGFVICSSLAIFNMLPIPLFDGDKFLAEILSFIKKETTRALLLNSLRFFAISLLILNIYLSLINFGLLA